jgi:hypothetical protein
VLYLRSDTPGKDAGSPPWSSLGSRPGVLVSTGRALEIVDGISA